MHYAYFADAWFTESGFMGAGVTYWDASDPNGAAYGNHAVRHAAGQAFVEALDPSPKTVGDVVSGEGLSEGFFDAFWEEILMPWDFAAGIVLVREAGGVVTRPGGPNAELEPGAVYGASGEALLEELMAHLRM